MKERVLKNWGLTRGLYFILGMIIMIDSLMNQQWLVALIGGYFASMGLFAFGCATGKCYGRKCEVSPKKKKRIHDVEFENVR